MQIYKGSVRFSIEEACKVIFLNTGRRNDPDVMDRMHGLLNSAEDFLKSFLMEVCVMNSTFGRLQRQQQVFATVSKMFLNSRQGIRGKYQLTQVINGIEQQFLYLSSREMM